MIKKVVAGAVLGCAVMLGATACGDDGPSSGKVTGRDHDDAYCTYILSGKVMVPICYPEAWYLKLDDGKKHGKHEVSQDAYKKCQNNQHYPECSK